MTRLQRAADRAAVWGTAFGLVGAVQWQVYQGRPDAAAFCLVGAALLTALRTRLPADAVSGRTVDS